MKETETHTAKHFALQLGSLVTLYLSLSFLVVMVFGIINIIFPDATAGYYEVDSSESMIRTAIAMVIVFFPAYLILTRFVNNQRRDSNEGSYLNLTKWLIYLSLLIGGCVLLGDLATVIMTYLNGEVTARFIYKALTVLLLVGAAFYYYLLDARGFWLKNEQKSVYFGAGVVIIVLVALVQGFIHVKAPSAVREQRLDSTQINDLQQIQWRIQDYYLTNQKLPENFTALGEPDVPKAPENRAAYRYGITTEGFELCATFTQPSSAADAQMYAVPTEKLVPIKNPDNWQHGVGETCFKRIVTPTQPTMPVTSILSK